MATTQKNLDYYRKNAEENYLTTPISVLRYISELEAALHQPPVVGRSGQLPCGDCENYAEWDNGIRWCSVCGTKLS
jgi:NADH pyrophosphatase NudC (nudix superfamily)